jgi:glycosyltransferase involved in cell wall biosynthesis
MKVLVIAHAHPDFSVGGGEIAAYNLYTTLRDDPDTTGALFLARSDLGTIGHGAIVSRRPGEYLWRQDMGDWFKLRTANAPAVVKDFRAFLRQHRPDTIYVHHYAHMGLEVLREIRHTLPKAKLVLTLHEYTAICNHQGQMVKTDPTNRLCYRSSLEDCHLCFPAISPESFWLRRRYIEKHFQVVDMFVSPSQFLRQRYVDWGIPADRITVIENGQPSFERNIPRHSRPGLQKIGFFGQVTEYKGVDTLLKALSLVPPNARRHLQVEIHGANLEQRSETFRALIEDLRAPLLAEGTLRWVGGYERKELFRKMSQVDWVVVPSIWWENSPMVIQEALVCGKPVLAADIGGMAEKVRDGVTGLHFEARNPFDLAEKLTMITQGYVPAGVDQPDLLKSVSYAESARLYKGLVA